VLKWEVSCGFSRFGSNFFGPLGTPSLVLNTSIFHRLLFFLLFLRSIPPTHPTLPANPRHRSNRTSPVGTRTEPDLSAKAEDLFTLRGWPVVIQLFGQRRAISGFRDELLEDAYNGNGGPVYKREFWLGKTNAKGRVVQILNLVEFRNVYAVCWPFIRIFVFFSFLY